MFDGTNHKPYHEMDAPHPVSIYGKTKLAGEQALKGMLSRAIIIRTSWLYSSFGNNFVKTMVSLSKEKTSLRVVYDQIGSPTYAADLAEAILQIARQIYKIKGVEVTIYSNEGVCYGMIFDHKNHCKPQPQPVKLFLSKVKIIPRQPNARIIAF